MKERERGRRNKQTEKDSRVEITKERERERENAWQKCRNQSASNYTYTYNWIMLKHNNEILIITQCVILIMSHYMTGVCKSVWISVANSPQTVCVYEAGLNHFTLPVGVLLIECQWWAEADGSLYTHTHTPVTPHADSEKLNWHYKQGFLCQSNRKYFNHYNSRKILAWWWIWQC